MPSQTIKISEANVSKAIRDLLAAKKIMVFRMNAGDRFGETNGKKWRIAGHAAGTADLLAIIPRGGEITRHPYTYRASKFYQPIEPSSLWIEVKAPGKKQSPEQIEFQRAVEAYGMTYLLVDNIDTLVDWLKARGL